MAAVTVNSREDSVFGNKRAVLANVSAAATGDTWVTGLNIIQGLAAIPPSSTAVTPSVSGGTVTFAYSGGGAMANIVAMAIGI